MTPGERCDEIMRLIDETLEAVAAGPAPSVSATPPMVSALRTLARSKSEGLARTA